MGGIKINNAYKPLYTSKKRYFLITGGRGSLKSSTVHDYISRLTFEPGHGILFTRYTMTSAEKSIIPEFKETLKRNGTESFFHITKNKITNLVTGSFILFSGIKTSSGDQTANLKSISGITTLVVEEGEDFNDEKAFDTIDDSIRSSTMQNRVIWIMNPATREHFVYKRWIEPSNKQIDIEEYKVTVSNHPEVEHIHTTFRLAEQNDYLSESFLHKIENTRINNPKKYYHSYIGGWLEKPEGVIFENWKEGAFDESLPFVWGMDFGYVNDPTTLVKVAINEKAKLIYIKSILYQVAMTTEDIDNFLKNNINQSEIIIADNAEPRLIAELNDLGNIVYPCTKGKDSIIKGITDLQGYTIIVGPEDFNAKKELNMYSWNDKITNKPKDDYNHIIDPIRYAYTELTTKNDAFFG